MLTVTLSWTHILALFIANFVIGWAWYSPLLFVDLWLRGQGKRREDMHTAENRKRMPLVMGSAAATALLLSLGSQVLVQSLGATTLGAGALVGLFVSLVLIAPVSSGTLFEGRSLLVYGIGVAHATVVVTLDCAVHAAWH
jgi:hypothetical protein